MVVLSCAVATAVALAACSQAGSGRGDRRRPVSPGTPTVATSSPGADAAGLSPLGAKWDISRRASFDSYLESLRGTATYTEVVWCKVEKAPGQRDWSKVDDVLAAAQQHGIELYLKIRVGACWATGGAGKVVRGNADKTESAMPTDMSVYAAFVRELVQRYSARGVRTYAIENEVNSQSFWAGSPAQYVALTRAAAQVIRATDSQAQIADAGMSSTTYGYGIADRLLKAGQAQAAIEAWNTYFQRRIGTRGDQVPRVASTDQLRAVLASAQGVRNLAYLEVARQLAQQKVTDVRQIHFYEPWQAVPLLQSYLTATTPAATPVQAWEVGSFWKDATATDASRAGDMVRTLTLLLAGRVSRAIWLPLATSGANRRGQEIRYGLLDPNGGMRPSGTAMQQLVAASRDAKITRVSSGGLQGLAFVRNATSTLVVWAGSGQVRLDVGAGAKQAAVGSALAAAPVPTVDVTQEPLLLQTSRPLADVLPQ